ncbi:hypothetical protein [Deinococcus arenicola]|uniref:RHS repeat protein n=1 Tax=Deinococcus arenicola TaxID=2994950 RepID=A0ABU4DTT1_9DEIO|nr:hypothetical protein [Deinococcus sp. ZS9-10]MDV6375382.1 hypothetical protein [Deinococcus sp. ZS9-10]
MFKIARIALSLALLTGGAQAAKPINLTQFFSLEGPVKQVTFIDEKGDKTAEIKIESDKLHGSMTTYRQNNSLSVENYVVDPTARTIQMDEGRGEYSRSNLYNYDEQGCLVSI